MITEKTNISARVEITLKKIVEESTFTHKDAYELGAMLIAIGDAEDTITLIHNNPNYQNVIKQTEYRLIEARKEELERELRNLYGDTMCRGNSDIIYFLEQHEQEIINCCKKGMSNNEVIELLKTKYDRDVAEITYRKFKAKLNLTKSDFLETLLDEISVMKTSGATDANVRRWLEEEHEIEVSRSTFSRFKKKYHLTDTDKDPRESNKNALTERAITQKQITDNNVHQDNIDLAIDTILQQQVTDIKTGLDNLDKITKNAVGLEIDFAKLDQEVRYNANEKNLARYLIDITELKIRYLELSVKAFEAKNRLFKDEMDRLFKNRVLELEDKKIEISQKDIMNEIEILAKQIDDNNVQ